MSVLLNLNLIGLPSSLEKQKPSGTHDPSRHAVTVDRREIHQLDARGAEMSSLLVATGQSDARHRPIRARRRPEHIHRQVHNRGPTPPPPLVDGVKASGLLIRECVDRKQHEAGDQEGEPSVGINDHVRSL